MSRGEWKLQLHVLTHAMVHGFLYFFCAIKSLSFSEKQYLRTMVTNIPEIKHGEDPCPDSRLGLALCENTEN
jgi:hypothetical protein